ncbi:MAG: GH39 family glycosyl hydrolase [Acidimicrobiales bacterium]
MVLVVLVVLLAGPWPAHGQAHAAQPARPQGASRPVFGIAYPGLFRDTPPKLSQVMHDARALGVTYIREQLSWASIEPTRGRYDWGPFDRVVTAVAANGLSLLVILDFTPAWARAPGCLSMACPPAVPAQFAAFARLAAQRYSRQGVHDWEIWNEPNTSEFWKPVANPATYSQLAELTARALRTVDRHALVISGGLAPAADQDGNMAPVRYLSQLCADGALGVVDAVGIHPYSYPVLPDYPAPWNAWAQMNDQPVSERTVIDGCGYPHKPIWITEYGAPTNGPGPAASAENPDLRAHPNHVTPQLQADMATEAIQITYRSAWIGALFWYSGIDQGTMVAQPSNFFGLRRADGMPKPAWSALRHAIEAGP